jgi:hypothetical protein
LQRQSYPASYLTWPNPFSSSVAPPGDMAYSCGNRHCPKCQGNARLRWLHAREAELLPTRYVHAVFTLPRELAPLVLQNKKLIFNLLFHSSAETLLEVARDPRHLGAEIGFFSVLHSWDQRLLFHPHVHCVLAAGRLAPDHASWISSSPSFFLPIKVLSRVFRGKFVAGLKTAYHAGTLQFHGSLLHLAEPPAFAMWLRTLFRHDWVVYAKRPFGGPQHALRYLGAYTHRVAISNHRLVALENGNVTFRWRDSAHRNKKKLMTLPVHEFLRRILLHLLPRGFVRIRNFGFLANRRRASLLPTASNSCAVPRKKRLQQRRYPRIIRVAVGVARSAVESCALSNASRPHNSCSVLHHWPSGAQHELAYKTRSLGVLRNPQGIFASSRAPASADTDPNRCQPPRRGTAHRISRLHSPNNKREHGIRSTASSHRPRSNCIGAPPGAASFKSLYLKCPLCSSAQYCPVGTSDTAQRLIIANPKNRDGS